MGKVRQHFNDPTGAVKLRIGEEMGKEETRAGKGLVRVDTEQQREINISKVSRKMQQDACALK